MRITLPLSIVASLMAVIQLDAQRADTIRVDASASPAWGWNVPLTRTFSIGALDGPPEYAFGVVDLFAVDRRGRFYIYDAKDRQIRAYDAAGKFVTKVGGRGAGPGEYGGVVDMAIVADTLLGIYDPFNARLTLYTAAGKLHRLISEPRATNWGGVSLFGTSAGRLYVRVPVRRPGVSEMSEGEGTLSGQRYLGFDTEGRRTDSVNVPIVRLASPTPRGFYLMLPEGGQSNFLPEASAVPSPNGSIVMSTSEAMRFVIRPASGAPIVVQSPWTPVPIAGPERENWEQWARYMENRDRGAFTYTIPRAKPAFKEVSVDEDSRIWVSLYAPAVKRDLPPRAPGDARPLLLWRQPATYDVYDPKGIYLGRVTLPHGTAMLRAIGDVVWVKGTGPDDEDIVTAYRMGWKR